jgi:hypothetical protein
LLALDRVEFTMLKIAKQEARMATKRTDHRAAIGMHVD